MWRDLRGLIVGQALTPNQVSGTCRKTYTLSHFSHTLRELSRGSLGVVEILRVLGETLPTYVDFLSPRPELYKMIIKELAVYCFPSPCPSSGGSYVRGQPGIYLGDSAPHPQQPRICSLC